MLVVLGAFIAGVLTTLAPCVLPMLPVIVGGSVAGGADPVATERGSGSGAVAVATATRRRISQPTRRALVITLSLGVSIGVFTLLLKVTTAFIGIPPNVWAAIAGALLIGLGLVGLFPDVWDRISARLQLQARSSARLSRARQHDGLTGQVLTGAALGPVFSSCSPLYGYVVVTVLPAQFGYGMLLLITYLAGLCATLLLICLAGQRLVRNVRWLADPHGWFRRGLGAVFILVGIAIATGFDKTIQEWILVNSPIAPWNLDTGFIPQ